MDNTCLDKLNCKYDKKERKPKKKTEKELFDCKRKTNQDYTKSKNEKPKKITKKKGK